MNANLCPMCGRPLQKPGKARRLVGAIGQWRQRRIMTYQSTALTPWQPETGAPAVNGSFEASRVVPVRPQNLESDFLTPLFQALGTGAFVTIGAGLFAWSTPGLTWVFGIGCGVTAAAIHWTVAIVHNPANLQTVETIIRSDLNGDGAIGEPPPARPVALEITHRNEGGTFNRMFRCDLPIGVTETDFREFAMGVIEEGRGLAESGWIGSGKPFSRQSYNALLTALEQAGIIRWKDAINHAVGRELTPSGARALRNWLKMPLTHSHSLNGGSEYEFIPGVG